MRRRDFTSGLLAAAFLSGAATAQDFASSVIEQLGDLGFQSVKQERTLLGRVRITAIRADGAREIIINPKTGEILRDLWTPSKGGSSKLKIIDDKSGALGGNDDSDGNDDHGGNDGNEDEHENHGEDHGGNGGEEGSGGGSDDDDDDGDKD
jgi:hypothetical protein